MMWGIAPDFAEANGGKLRVIAQVSTGCLSANYAFHRWLIA